MTIAQLEMMCELLGTPNERIWPDYPSLPLVPQLELAPQPYNELQCVVATRPSERSTANP